MPNGILADRRDREYGFPAILAGGILEA